MGRERFLFLPCSPPCGSALWGPDLSGRKSWRYSPECVEGGFSEVCRCLRLTPPPRGTSAPRVAAVGLEGVGDRTATREAASPQSRKRLSTRNWCTWRSRTWDLLSRG